MKFKLILVLAYLAVCGCQTVRPEPQTETGRLSAEARLQAVKPPRPQPDVFTTGDEEDLPPPTEMETHYGSGRFINERAAKRQAKPVSDTGQIVLNFEGESIQEVVHTVLGDILQETFVIGPGVTGEVTFATAKPISKQQVLPILEMLLRWNGATLVRNDGRYHVLPLDNAVRGHLVPRVGGVDNVRGFEVRAVPLRYISATEAQKILEPYARQGAILNVDDARGLLVVSGTREELRNYLQTIEIFDVDWLAGMSVGLFPLERVEVATILPELEAVFGAGGETPLSGMFRFLPLERLNAVMVITPQPEYLNKAKEWVARLDRAGGEASSRLYVYPVNNLEAQALADYLVQIYGGNTGGNRNRRRGEVAPGLQQAQVSSASGFNNRNRNNNQNQNQNNNRQGGGTVTTASGTEIRITAVEETNSLLIQSSPQEYEGILAAIKRLDEEPAQVLIEAHVIEVALNDQLEFGVNWFLSNRIDVTENDDGTIDLSVSDGSNTFTNNSLGRYVDSLSQTGGSVTGILMRPFSQNGAFVRATIQALDNVTDVRTISTPSLMVRNNTEATINVGRQVPVRSSSINTGSDNVVSSATYISTGTRLAVTPRINPGGLVYLTVDQEVSTPGVAAENQNPPIDTKNLATEIALQSGQTIMLGGLIEETNSRGRRGIPFLSRIPGIGSLFGTRTKNVQRSETLVLITPTVVHSTNELQVVSDEYRQKFLELKPLETKAIER